MTPDNNIMTVGVFTSAMRHLFLIIIITFYISSCTDNVKSAFEIDIETFFVIPAGLNSLDSHVFEIFNVPTFIQAINPNATPENVFSVKANRGRLTGRFTNIDYRIVDRIAITAVSVENPELELEVFYMDFIPLDQEGDLEMFSSLPEVKEILLQENIHLKVKLNFKTFVPSNIETRVLLNFKAFVE